MDWQQPVALVIVASAVLWLITSKLRARKRFSTGPGSCGCGCPAAGGPPKESITFRAKKGERSTIEIRSRT